MHSIFNNIRKTLKIAVGKLIELVEKYEYKDSNIFDNKFIDVIDIDEYVKTDSGFSHASKMYLTKPFEVYRIETQLGKSLECADNHLIMSVRSNPYPCMTTVYVKDLLVGDILFTEDGLDRVKSVEKLPYKMCMYDMSLDDENHRYYTNEILSHNTTTTAAYITWYVCFHTDRNVGIMANKQDTAIEIVDKTQQMIKGLPYFLKPGVVKWGQKGAKFDNGCAIISSATTKSASIGFTMNGILYLDEFAHIEPNICYDFWRSVYPTLSSSKTAQLIVSSTPNGTANNKFYDLWSGDNGMTKIRVDYYEVPGHDDAWAEEQKKKFGEEEFNQEFLLQFSSTSKSLVKGSSLKFMHNLSERLGKYKQRTLPYEKYLDDEDLAWCPAFDPNGISKTDRFAIIIDLAEGKGDEETNKKKHGDKNPDSNTIQIYKLVMNSPQNILRYKSDEKLSIKDAYRYVQIGRWESNEKDEVYCGHLAAAIALDLFHSDVLDNCRIMMEMNFNGKSCLGAIQDNINFYENLVLKTYHSKPIPGELVKAKKQYGFKTGAEKENFCKRGAKMIKKKRIIVTDIETYDQLKSFGYVGQTIKGIACHDDLSYPAVNHIPRMLDEAEYIDWLEEAFENEENTERKYIVNNIIEQYEMDDPDMSDEQFRSMYAGNDIQAPYHQMPQNTYAQYAVQQSPYIGGGYAQGGGYSTGASLLGNSMRRY